MFAKEIAETSNKGLIVLAESVILTHICPKCASPNLERRNYWYPTLGYGDSELACRLCGLLLWPRYDETPRRAYFRWLMDRISL